MRFLIHELAVTGLPLLVVKLVELPNLVRNTTAQMTAEMIVKNMLVYSVVLELHV